MKRKYVHSGYRLTCDSACSWSFYNGAARNVRAFGVDKSSASYANNCKNNFLVLGEVPTFRINGSFGLQEKHFSINFSKANTKFSLGLHYNVDNNYLFLNVKEIFKFKVDNNNVKFSNKFCLRSISNGFSASVFREVSLNENVYDF